MVMDIDFIDVQIINILKNNSREKVKDIAAKVNLSSSSTIERIKKLEQSGIISQYTIMLNNKSLGKDVTAIMFVNMEHPKYNKSFVARVVAISAVVECLYIAGDSDYLLKIVTDTTVSLEKTLNEIKSVDGVAKTKTTVVLSVLKHDLALTLK